MSEHDDSDGQRELDALLALFMTEQDEGRSPDRAAFIAAHPEHAGPLRAHFANLDVVANLAAAPDAVSEALDEEVPARIGRYHVVRELGRGGFGIVYLARDDELHRLVAVKVPRRSRVARPQDVDMYLAEARAVAALDHPGIVPVYDVGRTDDGLCFVVSKYVEGSDLAVRLRESRLPLADSTRIVAAVAEALHHAHLAGIVHRDVKPRNILLDAAHRAHLADFGLALKEEDYGKARGVVGTLDYMSPEQARGEGHRVDGRSDVFSLGVVLYELLTARRPFHARDHADLLEQIGSSEVRPPRQRDDTIPRELERICLKALANRVSDRYTTALDFAVDLRHFLGATSRSDPAAARALRAAAPTASAVESGQTTSGTTTAATVADSDEPLRIVPKGLRAFDAEDADFFLELLPGPRDREGLPESIRFWGERRRRIDAAGSRVACVAGAETDT